MITHSGSTTKGTHGPGAPVARNTAESADVASMVHEMAKENPAYQVVESGIARWPTAEKVLRAVPTQVAVGLYVTVKDEQDQQHTVSLQRDPTGTKPWTLWCGHDWLDGRAVPAARLSQFSAYHSGAPDATAKLSGEMGKSFGLAKDDADCSFTLGSSSHRPLSCDHAQHVSSLLTMGSPALKPIWERTKSSNLTDVLRFLDETSAIDQEALIGRRPASDIRTFDEEGAVGAGIAVPAISTSKTRSADEERLEEIHRAESSVRKTGGRLANQVLDLTSFFNGSPIPVLVAGPGGWGKTHLARALGRNEKLFDAYHEIPITPGTEMRDMVGGIYPVIDPDTKEKHFATVTGPLTQAMQDAKSKRTLVLMDEVGNLDGRGWNMMKNLLNPSNGEYTLQTDAPVKNGDGNWTLARQSVPVKNLVMVMTANVGEGYDGVLGDPAVRSRMVMLPFGPTRETVIAARKDGLKEAQSVLEESRDFILGVSARAAKDRGFPSNVNAKLGKVWDGAVSFVADDQLYQLPSPRNFVRAIETAKDAKDLQTQLTYQSVNWARLRNDNYPVVQQATTARKLVEKAFE